MEPDTPPDPNTFRYWMWQTTQALSYVRAFWGRRFFGGAIALFGDLLSEGASQAFYARLPGHPQQAADSLAQVGRDRDLFRFRGETDANWLKRVQSAWDDYAQAGTDIQLKRVINQWGVAGWPLSWNPSLLTLVETSGVGVFKFTLTIGYGNILPPWAPIVYGSGGHVYGEDDFFYGLRPSTDIPMLLYLVRKWKPARSQAFVKIYWSVSQFVTFIV